MITLITGAQYGGEGKGKVSAFIASTSQFDVVCRAGGVNCSHTVVSGARQNRLRLLPTACQTSKTITVAYGAGTLLHEKTLFEEIATLDFPKEKVKIDPQAGVVTDAHMLKNNETTAFIHLLAPH